MKPLTLQKAITLLSLTVTLTACGGGGSSSNYSSYQSQQPAGKTATVSFIIVSTARLGASVQGVQLSAYLPVGVAVATEAGSTAVSSTALTSGSGITSPTRQVIGSYSADVRKVKIIVATTEDTFRGGEFAKVKVSYPAASILTADDFVLANSPSFPSFEAAGYVVGSGSIDLTSKLKVSLGVSFD
jgi:hypothetical protein